MWNDLLSGVLPRRAGTGVSFARAALSLSLATATLWTIAMPPASAGPDACVQSGSSGVYTCSGNQSSGLTYASTPNASAVTVSGLSANIQAALSFILPANFAKPLTLTVADPSFRIAPSGTGYGILIQAPGEKYSGPSSPASQQALTLNLNVPVVVGGATTPAVLVSNVAANGSGGSGDGGAGGGGYFPGGSNLAFGSGGSQPLPYGFITVTGPGTATPTPGVLVSTLGGNGGGGATGVGYSGGRGGAGGAGGPVSATINGNWIINAPQIGLELSSMGGGGGNGGTGSFSTGGNAGAGGNGGTVTLTPSLSLSTPFAVSTTLASSPAVSLISQAGNGGTGGTGATFGSGGSGGGGGVGGTVTLGETYGSTTNNGAWNLTTHGAGSPGIVAASLGGVGGNGGDGGFFVGGGGGGGSSGSASTVTVNTSGGLITTQGADSPGIMAESIAGHGGISGSEYGLVSFSASGGSAGSGGTVVLNTFTAVSTVSDQSPAIQVQSIGGGGGSGGGGFGLFFANGGNGGNGGAGGSLNIYSAAALTTSGSDSPAVLVQSIGGAGGDGGSNGGLLTVGGKGAAASDGGSVLLTVSGSLVTGASTTQTIQAAPYPICTIGCSSGIVAQSIGGGGGNGGSSGGWFAVGGSAGGGGNGGTVNAAFASGTITTSQPQSYGVLVQSVGGGGGTGGETTGGGGWLSVAVGGSGGGGGNGGTAIFDLLPNASNQVSVTTKNQNSPGIVVQSLGGGGGDGGFGIALAVGNYGSISIGVGGAGGNGGSGGSATFSSQLGTPPICCGAVSTAGYQSPGIQVQSIGGGGGDGGFAVSASGSNGLAGAIAVGGTAGGGGGSGPVTVWSNTIVSTAGDKSPGLEAQSTGGGGGNGGLAISGSLTLGPGSLALAVGGAGGLGGPGGTVTVTNSGAISTAGASSNGLVAESEGGGGGDGALAVAGTVGLSTGANLALSVGGTGGSGGIANKVQVTNSGAISATGPDSSALVARSTGGGGGDGGISVSAAVTVAPGGASFPISVGGSGGVGGDGGAVTVTNSGALTASSPASAGLSSQSAPGLLAESIGGGGGDANWVGVLSVAATTSASVTAGVAVGGSGGASGAGGAVTVSNSGTITTYSANSDAISASSTGGGGGHAAQIINLTASGTQSGGTNISAALTVGRPGGGGGIGGPVSVSNYNNLTTNGAGSNAIEAVSVGGDGGRGSISGQLSAAGGLGTTPSDYAASIVVAGGGGNAQAAGTATVTSQGTLQTKGNNAIGIRAESIGGGGGDAGLTLSFATTAIQTGGKAVTIADGGAGGTGSIGADVSVTNLGAIITSGGASHGIEAESIGGTGGNAYMTISAPALTDTNMNVTVGGLGGTGANGGGVTVNNQGPISTSGDNASGIIARSVGGGGGASQAVSVSVGNSATSPLVNGTIAVSVGLQGAGGGNGGMVTVTNTGTITTAGDSADNAPSANGVPIQSYGIFAQSVGGGGGTGGAGTSVVPNITATQTSVALITTVGGKGGGGGLGGATTVTNSGDITTHEDDSHAIFAQSVGGGGGTGGIAAAISGFLNNSSHTLNVSIAVGGSGGAGNTGGTASVTNGGTINTYGDGAFGIFAQSVGGGGGDGGSAFALSLARNGTDTASQASLDVALGGNAGASGTGGAVSVTDNRNIYTHGQGAPGILAQSVGGGGGVGGSGTADTNMPFRTVSIVLGGTGGTSGDGGPVTVNQTAGVVSTSGSYSSAIYAQSVGGGGGRGGVGVYGDSFEIGLGGQSGSSGNGGLVTVTLTGSSTGRAVLSASGSNDSNGIFAQSIGGGGGQTGGIGVGIVDTPLGAPPIDIGYVVSGTRSQGNGSGGNVIVNLTSALVYTWGDNDVGIFAQSVGGGGGVSGKTSALCPTSNCGYDAGATGGTGNGGAVNISLVDSAVSTTGQNSHGIFAQSAAGAGGTAGGVLIRLNNSTVTATGAGASGIFADSSSGGHNGVLTVTLDATSKVTGGSGNAAGIRLLDGNTQNQILNYGVITTTLGTGGIAIREDGAGSSLVFNYGSIIGSVSASAYVINEAGGTLTPGALLNMGAGGRLLNQGTLEIGGGGTIAQTSLTGTLAQDPSGRLVFDLAAPSPGAGPPVPPLVINGAATLSGAIGIQLESLGAASRGTQIVPLLMATQGVTLAGLTLASPVVVQLQLSQPTQQSLALTYDVNFTRAEVLSALSGSQGAVASYLQTLYQAGALPGTLGYFSGFGSTADYAGALDRLSPEVYGANLWTAALAEGRFMDGLLDCRDRGATRRITNDSGCLVMSVEGWQYDRPASASAAGYIASAAQFSLGVETRLGPSWSAGAGFSYDNWNARANGNLWDSQANLFQFGAFIRRDFGAFTLSDAVAAGGGTPSVIRYVTPQAGAQGHQNLFQAGNTLRAEKAFELGNGTLKTRVDLNVLHLTGGGVTESGTLAPLAVNAASMTNVAVAPGVEWSTNHVWGDDTIFIPRVRLGVTQYLTNPSPVVSANFEGAAGAVSSLRVTSQVSRTYGDLSVGLTLSNSRGLFTGVNLFSAVSGMSYLAGGSIHAGLMF